VHSSVLCEVSCVLFGLRHTLLKLYRKFSVSHITASHESTSRHNYNKAIALLLFLGYFPRTSRTESYDSTNSNDVPAV
jgi:hypothetical protein